MILQEKALQLFEQDRTSATGTDRYNHQPAMSINKRIKDELIVNYNDYMRKSYFIKENYDINPSDDTPIDPINPETPSDTALVGEAIVGYAILGKGVPNKVGEAIVGQSVIIQGL